LEAQVNFRTYAKQIAVGLGAAVAVAVVVCATSSFAGAQTAPAADAHAAVPTAPTLDFDFYRTKVEPIFLKRREGHARCYTCHAQKEGRPARYVGEKVNPESAFGEKGGSYQATPIFLDRLAKGSTSWTEEQSRHNFQRILTMVTPGDPTGSHFLMHPLAPEAGGDAPYWHGGGRQFATQDDPDWKILAEWVRGQKLSGSSGK
jgi:hypothetical protein